MASATDSTAGDPVIADDPLNSSELDLFSNVAVRESFDFMKSPDALQTTMVSEEPKNFLNPQELVTTAPPDSPTNSLHDSSSDSVSSMQQYHESIFRGTLGTNADQTMADEVDDTSDWTNASMMAFDSFDSAFLSDQEQNHPDPDGLFQFGVPDGMIIDRSPFTFDVASRKSELSNPRPNMASPEMPMANGFSPKQTRQPSRTRGRGHRNRLSQAGRRREAPRDPSPVSPMTAGQSLVQSAALHTHSANPDPGSDLCQENGVNNMSMNNHSAGSSPGSFSDGNMPPAHPFSAMPQEMHMPYFNSQPAYQFPGAYDLLMMLNPMPPGVTKLILPKHSISKPKLIAKPRPEPSPDTLELFVSVVCATAMNPELMQHALERAARTPQGHLFDPSDEANSSQNGGEVRICEGCMARERKRAGRKKTSRRPEEDLLWLQDEMRRVVVFNCQQVKQWQPCGILDANGRPESAQYSRAKQMVVPMRIACYCRHHNEKMGYNVIFTLKDWKGQVVAQTVSNPIMITDDHKTQPVGAVDDAQQSPSNDLAGTSALMQHPMHMDPNSTTIPPAPAPAPAPNAPSGASHGFPTSPPMATPVNERASMSIASSVKTTPIMASASVPGRPLSRPSSPSQNGHMAKKRKSSVSRVPGELAMTPLDSSPTPPSAPHGANGIQVSAVTSPFSPNSNGNGNFAPQADPLFGQQNHHQVPFIHSPLVSNNQEMHFFANRRSESMDNLAMSHLYASAPASNHPSRAPSPNGLRNSVSSILQAQSQLAQPLSNGMFTMPMAVNQPRAAPIIHKIIPNEGPTVGGIEVTVLGASFFQGLEVWFGDSKATTTTYWGDSSLVCLLPPSPTAGVVPVTFGQSVSVSHFQGKQPPSFKYIDDSEDKLIRTALSVLGMKMSGKMVDVSDLARRILNDGNANWSSGSSANTSGGGGGPMFNHTSREHLETQLLKVLDLIDLDSSANRTRLDFKRSTGHTMLHLASSLGYHRLVAALLARGANKDARDRGGFTPLHLAAIHNHPELVKRLMIAGADISIRSLSGLTARDVAPSRAVERTLRSSRRHMRSRSGGLLQSRTASASSMASMWEPLTKAHTHQGPLSVDSSEESLEYTSGDFEDEDPDENVGLSMKRASQVKYENHGEEEEEEDDLEDSEELNNDVASMTTAMAAAFKEQMHAQLQQFQQTMGIYLQSLPNLPQVGMPQMRNFAGLPTLPYYQAYLPQAQFIRRMQQYVPGMSGNRDDTPAGDDQPKMDSRWWDISSSNKNGASSPPPAYDDIFPRGDLDKKIQSAARAAADAEADLKSAAFEKAASISATTSALAKTKKIPEVLEIGRKNAITKEQQDNFLRAREQKLKMLSNDRNLFFIWIPLLLVMICALLYSYFPSFFSFLWTSVCALASTASGRFGRATTRMPPMNRAVEL